MPKYFDGEKQIPFPLAEIAIDQLSVATLSAELAVLGEMSLSIKLPDYETSCLGFVLHIKKCGNEFRLMNIAGELELVTSTIDMLLEAAQHICGAKYSAQVQKAFGHPLGDSERRI